MISIHDRGQGNSVSIPPTYGPIDFGVRIDGNNNRIEFGTPLSVTDEDKITIFIGGDDNLIRIGRISARCLTIHSINKMQCVMEDGTSIHEAFISSNEPALVTIGPNCLIGRRVKIYPTDFHKIFVNGSRINEPRPIVIGEKVWLGEGATILKGSEIEHGAVIGAEAVVSGHIPSRTVAAGNPARVVRTNVDWEI